MSDELFETTHTDDEWEERFSQIADRMTEGVRHHAVALDDRHGDLIGSGLLVRHRDRYYIFTAGHVVEDCRAPLNRDALRLVTLVENGQISLDRNTQLCSDYKPDGGQYRDAGIVCLTPGDAAKVSGWTNNTWYVLPDQLKYTEMYLHRPIDGRIFVVTGFAPHGPHGLVRDCERRRISYTYTAYATRRAEQQKFDGAFSFSSDPEEWTALFTDNSGAEEVSTFPPHRLSGMSGAPVWTFDFAGNTVAISQVGFHSASNATELIAVPSGQHVELLLASVRAAQ